MICDSQITCIQQTCIEDEGEIETIFTYYFKTIYGSGPIDFVENVLDEIQPKVASEMQILGRKRWWQRLTKCNPLKHRVLTHPNSRLIKSDLINLVLNVLNKSVT